MTNSKVDNLNDTELASLLAKHPELYVDVQRVRWLKVLLQFSDTVKESFPWSRLNTDEWVKILSANPNFIDYYSEEYVGVFDFNNCLCSRDWVEILICQPSLIKHPLCPIQNFLGNEWYSILEKQPNIIDDTDQLGKSDILNSIDKASLGMILKSHPDWLEEVNNIDSFSPKEILYVADSYPAILKDYDLTKFKDISMGDSPWIELHPQLLPYTSWNFSQEYWKKMLVRVSKWLEGSDERPTSIYGWDCPQSRHKQIYVPQASGYNTVFPSTEKRKQARLNNSLKSVMDFRDKCQYTLINHIFSHEPPEKTPTFAYQDETTKKWTTGYDIIQIANTITDPEPTEFNKFLFWIVSIRDWKTIKEILFKEEYDSLNNNLCFIKFLIHHSSVKDRENYEGEIESFTGRIEYFECYVRLLLKAIISFEKLEDIHDVLDQLLSIKNNPYISAGRAADSNIQQVFSEITKTDVIGNSLLHYFFFRVPWWPEKKAGEQSIVDYALAQRIVDKLKELGCSSTQKNRGGYSYEDLLNAFKSYLEPANKTVVHF